jgi:hypothetical protein
MQEWLSQRVILSPEVMSQEVNDETVLLDLASEAYFGLDPVGTRIWQLLQADASVQNAYQALLEEFEVSDTQLAEDLNKLLSHLHTEGLIQQEAAAAT